MSDSTDIDKVERAIGGLPLRSIGPALMGGRISDIAIHPSDRSTWYVGVGSGGVWKTVNSGITWAPLFDDETSYSIGCVRIDPSRPQIVWVGTGEAVSGRHVGWGDGVYRSIDAGHTWTRMGLERSEHISDILIDPRDGDTVYVAAEGPLWSSGGERGLYKTTDGGATWARVLHVDDDTGVTSATFAPDDPDTIYAATYQRRRRVWSFLGGGPGSGVHVSDDAGATFTRIDAGLPTSEMGRIGLAVSPADPGVVYATIEAADEKERGFYRSTTRGRTWERRNEYLSGGTGPHYYQELFASPTDADRVYQVDVFLHVTIDGGATFRRLETGMNKHSDNHVVWIDPTDGRHLIVGSDAGLYESFDEGKAWRHVSNLPISQFYRVAVDDAVPFTSVLGGAQDLGTLHGPTRTLHVDGVRNQDWSVVLGSDGYHVAFDPDDDRISYVEFQGGNVMRHDRSTMELRDIRPLPAPNEPPERWNWDTPIVISPHRAETIYVASQRLWRSDDRGESWTSISPDLTTDRNRYELPTGDRVVSVDSVFDHAAMSLYCTITAVAESPLAPGLLYVGTDDGLLQVSDDGGTTWRRMTHPDGLPSTAFVNDIEASQHDADVVIVAADDHKSGDDTPYLFESRDRGHTWVSICGDLPDDTIVWSVEQDHEQPALLFVGAERGVHVSVDGGARWYRLTNGVPTIAVRDLAIQRRDDDLVVATFGRGFYVLDDYSALRSIADRVDEPVALCPVRDAWWYVPYQPMQAVGQPTLGSTAFRTPNPEFGATFTYHLATAIESRAEVRRAAEAEAADDDIAVPGWDELRAERLDVSPTVVLRVRDAEGTVVRVLPANVEVGLHRTTWDLRRPAPDPISLEPDEFRTPWDRPPVGDLAPVGHYCVDIVRLDTGGAPVVLAGPESFEVRPTPAVSNAAENDPEFRLAAADQARRVAGAVKQVERLQARVRHLRATILVTPAAAELLEPLDAAARALDDVAIRLLGDTDRIRLSEAVTPSIRALVDRVVRQHRETTGPPTRTQRDAIERSRSEFATLEQDLAESLAAIDAIAARLDAAGGTWTDR
ncbi:MAG: glycosyl hydrolase [Ilumatobacteraceae bacterium]